MKMRILGTATVELPGAGFPHNLRKRRSMNIGDTADGTPRVYDRQTMRYWTTISAQLNSTQLGELWTFVNTHSDFAFTEIEVQPDADVDLGNGLGAWVDARWMDDEFEETWIAPGVCQVKIPLRVFPS